MAIECPLDEVVLIDVQTSSPTTGAATTADSTPTFAVYEETTDTDIGVGGNFTLRSGLTGSYRAQFTASAANGFELGKFYTVYASATVGAIAGKCVVRTFRIVAAENVAGYPLSDATKLAGQAITAAAGVTFPSSVASPTNITAGTITTVTNLTNAPTSGDLTATMKTSVTTAATAATPAVTVSDKTGFSLSTAGILAIWHQLTAAIVTASSIGKLVLDNLDAAISTRTKPADTQAAVTLVATTTAVTNDVGITQSGADKVWGTTSRTLSSFGTLVTDTVTAVWAAVSRTLTAFAFTPNLDPAYDAAKTAAQAGDAMTLTAAYDAAKTAGDATAANQGTIASAIAALPSAASITTAVWATGTRTLSSFGTLVADTAAAVWASVSRTLTAFGFTVAATVADKADYSLTSDYDPAKTAAQPGDIPSSADNADALLDLVDGIETGITPRQAMRLLVAALGGKLSGAATTTIVIRNAEADSKDRITATVDADGNRSAVTLDLT